MTINLLIKRNTQLSMMQSATISLNEKQKTQGAPPPPPPHSGLYREATLEMGAFFKLAVYGVLKSRKIVILVYERASKFAAKRKRWQLKLSIC